MSKRIQAIEPDIVRDYLADVPLPDICDRYSVSVTTIYNALYRANVPAGARRSRHIGYLQVKWSDPAYREAARRRNAKRAKLHPKRVIKRGPKVEVPPEKLEDWKTFKSAGYTNEEAAAALGLL